MLSFEGILKLFQKGRDFTDRETGVVTPAKFTHHIQIEDASGVKRVLELRSKEDLSDLILGAYTIQSSIFGDEVTE